MIVMSYETTNMIVDVASGELEGASRTATDAPRDIYQCVSTSHPTQHIPTDTMNIVSPLSDLSFGSRGDVTVLPNGLSDLLLPYSHCVSMVCNLS